MVAEAAAGPAQVEEARQASVQELQSFRDSLNQAEAKTKDLEGQLENLNGVKHWTFFNFDMKRMFFVTVCHRKCVNSNVIFHLPGGGSKKRTVSSACVSCTSMLSTEH